MTEWKQFWRTALKTALFTGLFLFAFVVVLDPYDTLPFSPPLDRYPVTTNQRFSYPAVATDPVFDSLAIGTSTTRLLKPDSLDVAFGGRFANLSLNSGRAYEQMRLADLFFHHHPAARRFILGVDTVWCGRTRDSRFTERPFPPWLYDENPWNDALYLFNPKALEEAGRQLAQLLGLREPKYDHDGYAYFLPPPEDYDAEKVRQYLYHDRNPFVALPEVPPADGYAAELQNIEFPQLDYLRRLLTSIPNQTEIIVFFVPYHQVQVPVPGSKNEAIWNECKRQIADIVGVRKNAHVVDFMIRSDLTMNDDNYWDPLHFTDQASDILVRELAAAVRTGRSDPSYYRYLATGPSAD